MEGPVSSGSKSAASKPEDEDKAEAEYKAIEAKFRAEFGLGEESPWRPARQLATSACSNISILAVEDVYLSSDGILVDENGLL